MKYLKNYNLFESVENDIKYHKDRINGRRPAPILEIRIICKKYNIENYTINEEDGSIDVDGIVNLSKRNLTKLPIKFRNVTFGFDCGFNKLTSLEGCPESVGGNFYCYNNQLKSLDGSPKLVGGIFDCGDNKITSLEGLPISVGAYFYCKNNPIEVIWKLIEDYLIVANYPNEKIELFNDYDILRGDHLILDRLNTFLEAIGKKPVESVKGWKCI